jgi:cysteine desulfurase
MNCYLDHNATAPLRPEARMAMLAAMDLVGNPSSVHRHGRAARQLLEQARRDVAALVGVPAAQIVFTSGATEANNLALAAAHDGACAISAVEHESIIGAASPATTLIAVDRDGVINADALADVLATSPKLVSVMAANNETGVKQPVADIAAAAHQAGALFHCDMVQLAGKQPLDGKGIDLISLSAHKIGGPAGVGALVVAPDLDLAPLLRGGGQEKGRRGGTENLVGIAGFAAAARAACAGFDDFASLRQIRDGFESALLATIPAAQIMGRTQDRLVNTSCIALPGVAAATLVMALDLAGFSVSAGAACSSGKVERSHVLTAMAVDEWVRDGAVRISLGWDSTAGDLDGLVDACERMYKRASGEVYHG